MRDVSQGEACPTDSGFVEDQDRANIAKTSTLPHESTSRVTSLAADEGNLQLCFQELTNFCTSLQRQQNKLVSKFATQALEITDLKARVKFLEDRQGEGINLSKDDAPIKGRRLDEEEVATERVSSDTEEIRRDEWEVVAERVSDDTKEMATVLIIMDAASVLSSGGVQVLQLQRTGSIARNCTARPRRRDAAYLQTLLLIAQKEEAGIQLQAGEFDFMADAGDLDEIKKVNANFILMENL
nr:hypothetical protein [Tanacetum cinerariifolium]